MCHVTGRLGDGVTDTPQAKCNKHSTSRALRKKQRESEREREIERETRLGVYMSEC